MARTVAVKMNFVMTNSQGQVLESQGSTLWGTKSLLKSIEVTQQFFQLKTGDVVILNDPNCGGFFPWALNLVTKTPQYWLAATLRFKTPWKLAPKIDEESLRLPPTPLIFEGQWQENIFQALMEHPFADRSTVQQMKQEVLNLSKLAKKMEELSINYPIHHPRTKSLQHWLMELPHGEVQTDLSLSSGENIRLKVESSDRGFLIDFSGTSAGQTCFVGESLMVGVCQEFIKRFYNMTGSFHWDIDSFIKITSPRTSFLQSRFPQGQLHGLARGVSALQQALQKCFLQIHAYKNSPQHNFFSLWLQIKNSKKLQQWILPTGSGATAQESGLTTPPWDMNHTLPDTDDLQNFFEIIDYDFPSSRFSTKHAAGAGLGLKLKCIENCDISWIYEPVATSTTILPKHSQMLSNSILIDGIEQSPWKEMNLQTGQILEIKTGAGSGWL